MGLRDASASQNTNIGILSAGNGGGMFSVKWTFCKFFLGVASSWQGGLLSTPPGKAPQGKKTIPIVEHGPEWSEYIVEVWAIFWTTLAVNRKISSLSGGRVQLQPKGNPQTFFPGGYHMVFHLVHGSYFLGKYLSWKMNFPFEMTWVPAQNLGSWFMWASGWLVIKTGLEYSTRRQ